ncbi:hypothetical protein CDIK_1958 [Cucumispora dikerogammari]|nr:hypothetical protein CDIK_1958 [Cucumispora dikerogammari]
MLEEILGLHSKSEPLHPFPHPFLITPTSLSHFNVHKLISFVYKNFFSLEPTLQIIAHKIQTILVEYFHFISNETINKETLIIFIEKKHQKGTSLYTFLYENPQLLLNLKPFIIRLSNLNYLVNSIDNNNVLDSLFNIEIESEEINLIKSQCESFINKKIYEIFNCQNDLLETIKESELFILESTVPFKESLFDNILTLKTNNFLLNEKENILFCLKYKIYRFIINQHLNIPTGNKTFSILSFELAKEMKIFMKNFFLKFLSELKQIIFFQMETNGEFIKVIETTERSFIFQYFSSTFSLDLLDLPQTNPFLFKDHNLFIEKEIGFFLSG